MNLNDIQSQVARDEDGRRQFKHDVTNAGGLAARAASTDAEKRTDFLPVCLENPA